MAISSIKALLQADVQKVWDTVASPEKYQWRSDLNKVEILNEKQFIEYTENGFATMFTIMVSTPRKHWEFDMENKHMRGHWTGVFTAKGKQTEIEFTEDVTAKKLIMKPFLKPFLKKQQKLYLADLEKALKAFTPRSEGE